MEAIDALTLPQDPSHPRNAGLLLAGRPVVVELKSRAPHQARRRLLAYEIRVTNGQLRVGNGFSLRHLQADTHPTVLDRDLAAALSAAAHSLAPRSDYSNLNAITPPTMITVPSARCNPNASLRTKVAITVANSTEVSRSAATLAIGATVMAHSAMA